jgi:hypothetical protein
MTGSYFMIRQVYRSLQEHLVVLTMEGRATKVEEIPFPAITFVDRIITRNIDTDLMMNIEGFVLMNLNDDQNKVKAKIKEHLDRVGGSINTLE